jgi:hypothetical protein
LISCIFGDLRIDDISQNGKLIKLTNDKKNASVIAYQKSEINQEDTEIFINGKVMIQYRQSGRRITMSENNKNEVLLGENEIEKMLLFECKDYIDWASFSVASKLPKLNNATLVNLLKKFGKDCE